MFSEYLQIQYHKFTMAQLRISVFLLCIAPFVLCSISENIPYSEYNIGIVFQIVSDLIGNTVAYQIGGRFAVEEVVTYHCRTP